MAMGMGMHGTSDVNDFLVPVVRNHETIWAHFGFQIICFFMCLRVYGSVRLFYFQMFVLPKSRLGKRDI